MQTQAHIPTAEAIVTRCQRIGLPVSRLALAAGLQPSTVSRWKSNGYSANTSTLRKMAGELERRERDLLAYLMELHPDARASA